MKNIDIQSQIKKFEVEVNLLRNIFIEKYFGKIDEYDFYWIREVGGVLVVNDYFFDFSFILDALRFNAPKKKFFAYHEKESELAMKDKKMKVNFETWLKLK